MTMMMLASLLQLELVLVLVLAPLLVLLPPHVLRALLASPLPA